MLIGYTTPEGFILNSEGKLLFESKTKLPIKLLSDEGQLLLTNNEKVLHTDPDQNFNVWDKWSETMLNTVFEGNIGSGEIIITNMRVFFSRIPPDSLKILSHYGGYLDSMPEAISNMMAAKKAKKLELKEYCQFGLDEIVKIEDIKKDISYADIQSDNNRYRVVLLTIWANIIKSELKHKLKKIEQKGFMKKYNIYWYVDPESISKKKKNK
jgi:hypothetical protein